MPPISNYTFYPTGYIVLINPIRYIERIYLIGEHAEARMNHLINNSAKLAQTLKAARKRLNWSQKEASYRSGLLTKTISLLENNPEKCSVETLMKHLSSLNLELFLADIRSTSDTDNGQEW